MSRVSSDIYIYTPRGISVFYHIYIYICFYKINISIDRQIHNFVHLRKTAGQNCLHTTPNIVLSKLFSVGLDVFKTYRLITSS